MSRSFNDLSIRIHCDDSDAYAEVEIKLERDSSISDARLVVRYYVEVRESYWELRSSRQSSIARPLKRWSRTLGRASIIDVVPLLFREAWNIYSGSMERTLERISPPRKD